VKSSTNTGCDLGISRDEADDASAMLSAAAHAPAQNLEERQLVMMAKA
jgi:hypothetical protein